MKYTFLLPAYKSAFLKQALQSILCQTFCDFKVLVSDDCSPEPIKEVVDGFANDSRVCYRRNESNFGAIRLVDHWNMLLSLCDSEYVIVASDDDVYEPRFLEEVEKLTTKYPNVDLFHARANTIDAKGVVGYSDSVVEPFCDLNTFLLHFLNSNSVLCIGNYVFKTSMLKRLGGFVNFPNAWKSDTATQIALAVNGVVNTEDILFNFRMSGINISWQHKGDNMRDRQKLDALFGFYKWFVDFCDEHKLLISNDVIDEFKYKLEAEVRGYYWTLNVKEVWYVYQYMKKTHWFQSLRNHISFWWYWVKVSR